MVLITYSWIWCKALGKKFSFVRCWQNHIRIEDTPVQNLVIHQNSWEPNLFYFEFDWLNIQLSHNSFSVIAGSSRGDFGFKTSITFKAIEVVVSRSNGCNIFMGLLQMAVQFYNFLEGIKLTDWLTVSIKFAAIANVFFLNNSSDMNFQKLSQSAIEYRCTVRWRCIFRVLFYLFP